MISRILPDAPLTPGPPYDPRIADLDRRVYRLERCFTDVLRAFLVLVLGIFFLMVL